MSHTVDFRISLEEFSGLCPLMEASPTSNHQPVVPCSGPIVMSVLLKLKLRRKIWVHFDHHTS